LYVISYIVGNTVQPQFSNVQVIAMTTTDPNQSTAIFMRQDGNYAQLHLDDNDSHVQATAHVQHVHMLRLAPQCCAFL